MPMPPTPQPAPPPATPPATLAEPLIAGRFAVDVAQPLPGAGGGLPAFAATDRRTGGGGYMAIQVAPGAPPRAHALAALADFSDARVLAPLAHGAAPGPDGRPAWYVVCPTPPGPPLWPRGADTIRPWSDADLIARLLRPAASALEALERARVTHRAIRPQNLFADPALGAQAVLGTAWAAPAASTQAAVFEPPYMAMCAPAARGEGRIADDVYALGVTMLALALGRMPLAGLDDDDVVRRKLELGCFQALAGDARLSPAIADLAAGMLAADPEHRPPPALLADPAAARTRRLAARPPRRAPRALEVGDMAVFDSRSLAYAIARQPDAGARVVRNGVADHWLRRLLGDTMVAARIEDLQRVRNAEGNGADAMADARLVVQSVAMLDPLAPLCWRGVALWPDAIGTALVAEPADATLRARIEEIVAHEVVGAWAAVRAEHCDPAALRQDARQQRAWLRLRGWAGGMARLEYALNPLLPCRGRVFADRPAAQVQDVLPALEAAAARADVRAAPPIDRETAAFLAARMEGRLDAEIAALGDAAEPFAAAVRQVSVLAEVQARQKAPPLPALAAWLAGLAAPTLPQWHNRATQAARDAALAEAVPAGDLAALLGVIDDRAAREADQRGHAEAWEAVRRLDARIARLIAAATDRAETALRLGQETAAAIGVMALVAAIVVALLV
jgi:hypothetical protein